MEFDPMVGARPLAILELGLRDGGLEINVPQRRRFELIREPAIEQVQECRLRHPLGPLADRGVGPRPVDRQAEMPPQVLEDLLVFGRQPRAQLDEVGTRNRDRLLAGRLGRNERRIVRQRRIAAHAVEILNAALGRKPVVVPPHRVEDRLPAHPLKPRDEVGVGKGKDVADVQRAADRRRRRVDRIDIGARPLTIEAVDTVRFPNRCPFGLEAFERRFFGNCAAEPTGRASRKRTTTTEWRP